MCNFHKLFIGLTKVVSCLVQFEENDGTDYVTPQRHSYRELAKITKRYNETWTKLMHITQVGNQVMH